MNREERHQGLEKIFLKMLNEKIKYVCSGSCWTKDIFKELEKILGAGDVLSVYKRIELSSEQQEELKALHRIEEFYDMRKTLIDMLNLHELYPNTFS